MRFEYHNKIAYLYAPTPKEIIQFHHKILKPSHDENKPITIEWFDYYGCDGSIIRNVHIDDFVKIMNSIKECDPYAYIFRIYIHNKGVNQNENN